MKTILQHIGNLRFQALLLAAAAIWGLSTVVLKGAVDALPPAWLVGIRFTVAGLVFCAAFAPRIARLARGRRLGDHARAGLALGLVVGIAYLLNAVGISFTTAAKSSFLTGSYCIMVPFLAWAMTRVRPSGFNLAAAALCLGGIALVSLPEGGGFALGFGDSMSLVGAVFLGIQVVLTAKLAPGRDMLVLTALQFLVGGLACLAVAPLTAPAPALALFADPALIGQIAFLVLGGTCGAILFQNIGLAHVAPAPGALLLSFESVFGVLFSVMLLGEALTAPMSAGFALIFASVLVSEWLPQSPLARRGRTVLAGVRERGALTLAVAFARYVGARSAATARSLFSVTAMSSRSRAFLNVRPPEGLMDADSVVETSATFPNLPVVVQYADAKGAHLDRAA